MDQELIAFLNKFVAALRLKNIERIPFVGKEFQDGIDAVKKTMKETLDEGQYSVISPVFAKVPVDEEYESIRNMFIHLNGDTINFTGADNPRWEYMTIKMNPYLAHKKLKDDSILNIDSDIFSKAAIMFCSAAGVDTWA